jgi:osmotically-inducible protein OsmY
MKEQGRLTLVLFFAASVFACDRRPDPSDQVKDALRAEKIDHVNVNYDRDSKVIHLKGSVDSNAEKMRAEQAAAKAIGTAGHVLNELTVEGTAERRADDLDGPIRTYLNEQMNHDAVLKDRNVNFDVNNGAVEIKGSVASATEKTRVGEIVRGTKGVKDVANALEVRPDEYADQKRPATNKR